MGVSSLSPTQFWTLTVSVRVSDYWLLAAAGCRAMAADGSEAYADQCHTDQLPAELLQLVLSELPLQQLLAVQRVSRRWREAVCDMLKGRQELDMAWLQAAMPSRGSFTQIHDEILGRLLRLMPGLRILAVLRTGNDCESKALDIAGERSRGSGGGDGG